MIHYFSDKFDGFIGVDTSQRVREAPSYFFGRGASTPGDISTIQERIWNPINLGTSIPIEEVLDDWLTALGFENEPVTVRPGRQSRQSREPREPRAPREPEWVENNPLPGKSFLVPLVPMNEYLDFMATSTDRSNDSTDIRFPWEKTHPRTALTMGGCIFLFMILGLLGLCV